jgi:hypothetical protein
MVLYRPFSFLHHTPNLQSLFYKTPEQFSYQIGRTPPCGSWAITERHEPVSLPVFLPHLWVGDVSASGGGTDLLRNIAALNLERVCLDGSRIQDDLEDWTMSLNNRRCGRCLKRSITTESRHPIRYFDLRCP